MAGRRRKSGGQNLPAVPEKGQPQEDSVRDAPAGRQGDGVHVPVDDGQAVKQGRVPQASGKPKRRPRKNPEVAAPSVPLPEPFASAGCHCATCPYAKDGRPQNFLLPTGPRHNPVGLLVLGGGPTRDEVKQQEHLAGMMGKEMAATLEEAGIERSKLLIATAYACQAEEPKRLKDERAATNACRPLLLQQLAQTPPATPTLLAGKWALLAMTGKEKGLFTTRGFVDKKWRLTDAATKEDKAAVDDEAEDVHGGEHSGGERHNDGV